MIAILGGFGAALIWSVGAIFASRAAQKLGPRLTLAWVMGLGLVMMGAILPFSSHARLSSAAVIWLVVGGAGNVGGLLLMYRALRVGQMGVVMPVVSTEGGIAALIAIITGQAVGVLRGAALAVTVLGVMLTAFARSPVREDEPAPSPSVLEPAMAGALEPPKVSVNLPHPRGHEDRVGAAWACLGALVFGVGLFGTGRAGSLVPAGWAILPPRVVGVVVVTLPMALRGQLRVPTGMIGAVTLSSACEIGGFYAYAVGARHGIAVAAVLSTLTGAIAAGFGRVLFGERLRFTQLVGIATIFVGVATLSLDPPGR
ncbi:MAG TPA: EamA family transporter [Solirubrobacteraceae bacterium]|nr:EamA family transporter [Solirubrobacteraceae bacterium]